MYSLTKNEKLAALFLLGVVVSANVIQLTAKHWPAAERVLNIVERDKLCPRIDINRASFDALEAVPYISRRLAGRILDYRRKNGDFKTIGELRKIPGVTERGYRKIESYLMVGQNNTSRSEINRNRSK